ncbi:MAG TPA: M48 family metallopeptidase [Candidatus Limnocylindrales bacterium]|nr:M48 family metallopeptidase [Candidatus Limnocylindrales bacterium]
MKRMFAGAGLALIAAALVYAGDQKDDLSKIGSRDVGKGVNFYSMEKEIALGRQLAQEVKRQTKVLDDPIVGEFVNRVGQNLVRNSDAKVPFTFEVLDGPEVNAFALPGGYVFVYSGLLKMADEEDEFAAVLAHEIAHVAARHMTREATRQQIAHMGRIPLAVVLGGAAGAAARESTAVMPLPFLHFERKDENEADYLGVEYLYAAGYDPTGAVSMFEKLEAMRRKDAGAVKRLFSTHPADADRIERTQREIERILPSRPTYVVTTAEYTAIHERLLARQ